MISCNNDAQKESAAAQQRTIDSMKDEMVKKQIIDSMNAVNTANPVVVTHERTIVHHSSTESNTPVNRTTTTSETNIATSNAAKAPVQTKKRKGLGATATGAIIGAGVGGITGAMVDKKKGEGAIVGGILGAGAGAGVGAIINKKQKQKDQKEQDGE